MEDYVPTKSPPEMSSETLNGNPNTAETENDSALNSMATDSISEVDATSNQEENSIGEEKEEKSKSPTLSSDLENLERFYPIDDYNNEQRQEEEGQSINWYRKAGTDGIYAFDVDLNILLGIDWRENVDTELDDTVKKIFEMLDEHKFIHDNASPPILSRLNSDEGIPDLSDQSFHYCQHQNVLYCEHQYRRLQEGTYFDIEKPNQIEPKEILPDIDETSTIPIPAETLSTVPEKKKGVNLKIQFTDVEDIRWLSHRNKEGPFSPLPGTDSMLIEMKDRFNKNGELDENAKRIYEKHMENKFTFRKNSATCQPPTQTSRQNSDSNSGSDEEYSKILIKNRLYRVNRDNTKARSLYWKNDVIHLTRGTYFALDKPIEPELAGKIDEIRQSLSGEDYGKEFTIELKSNNKTEKVNVRFHNAKTITIRREGQREYQYLDPYKKRAKWNDKHLEVDHLVLAVHGICNNNHRQGIEENAKLLNLGINGHTEKGCGVIVLPVHWRTDLKRKEGHQCPFLTGTLLKLGRNLFEDLKMYDCSECGSLIRKKVIEEFNNQYNKFLKYNPTFSGTVSLFGHSLGSVICYDILTNHSTELAWKSTKKLFTVGSPLRFFITERGKAASDLFRNTVKKFQVHNIYHLSDPVAERLEPILHPSHENAFPIGVPTDETNVSLFHRGLKKVTERAAHFRDLLVSKSVHASEERNLHHPIDNCIHGAANARNYHGVYWKHDGVYRCVGLIFERERRNSGSIKTQSETTAVHDERSAAVVPENHTEDGKSFRMETLQAKPNESKTAVFIDDRAITVSEIEGVTVETVEIGNEERSGEYSIEAEL